MMESYEIQNEKNSNIFTQKSLSVCHNQKSQINK
jgi:hypothetical protein